MTGRRPSSSKAGLSDVNIAVLDGLVTSYVLEEDLIDPDALQLAAGGDVGVPSSSASMESRAHRRMAKSISAMVERGDIDAAIQALKSRYPKVLEVRRRAEPRPFWG